MKGREENTSHGEHETDDAEAVTLARAGDLDAARYTSAAHRTAYLLGAGDEAEDVVQEAFVKGFRALDSFRPGAPFRPWLLRIVANETRNLHRSGRRRTSLELRAGPLVADAVDPHDPETEALAQAARDSPLDAVRGLPDKDRLVVTCRYFLELSEAETAQVLGWPRGSVKSRLSRAIDRLRPVVAARMGKGARGG